ncbi:hypothetical protein DICVIV_08470 [Dictyocaulus viviparus]|uniref:Uncharacterized protein n=1 Tax=Dictyocaulus viviparus TaxID=29172 RepID=A0A0D8XNZ2_DICVI|nr:hypothetical protein DICVIV_08470 [Dictyocaulus viviparus]
MALGLSLSSDIWRFFIENVEAGEEYSMSFDSLLEWELIWLKQVACLPTEGLNLSDPYNPVVQFSLRCEEYWITIRPGYAFPHQSPIVKCAYQQGFYFDWCSKDECSVQVTTLTNVVQWYRDYCESIDAAILQIKSADNNFFTLLEYSMHNEDPECFAVKLCPKNMLFAYDEAIWRTAEQLNSFYYMIDKKNALVF